MQLSEIVGLFADSRVYAGIIASLVGAAFYLMVRAEWPSLRPSAPSSQVITPLRLSGLILLAVLIGIIGTGVVTGKFEVLGTSALAAGAGTTSDVRPELGPRDLLIIAAFGYVGLDAPAIIQKLILLPAAIVKAITELVSKSGGAA